MTFTSQDAQSSLSGWRLRALQLTQNYQAALSTYTTLDRRGAVSPAEQSALVAAGEAIHESAGSLNQFLDSGYSASRLATDIYNRLNAVGGAPLSPVERPSVPGKSTAVPQRLRSGFRQLHRHAGPSPRPASAASDGIGRARHAKVKDEQSDRFRNWHARDSEVIQRGRCAAT